MRKEDLLKPSESVFVRESKFINTDNSQGNESRTLKTGTTTVGLVCKDAVILGADKRASMAYFVSSKTAEKLQMIQEHLYMTIAGTVADAFYLVDVIKAETALYQFKEEKPIKVKSAGKLLSNILYQNKMFPYQVGLMLGGVTEEEGPVLLDIGAYGSVLPEKFCAIGSGQNFSYGVLEAKYKDNLTVKEGKDIVIKAITSSIIRDMASGNGIDIAVVKKEGPAEKEFISIKE
ncbi:MAG: proteasome subunit beta [Promethearchaeota archaeon]|jgi:proteasome beta subunit